MGPRSQAHTPRQDDRAHLPCAAHRPPARPDPCRHRADSVRPWAAGIPEASIPGLRQILADGPSGVLEVSPCPRKMDNGQGEKCSPATGGAATTCCREGARVRGRHPVITHVTLNEVKKSALRMWRWEDGLRENVPLAELLKGGVGGATPKRMSKKSELEKRMNATLCPASSCRSSDPQWTFPAQDVYNRTRKNECLDHGTPTAMTIGPFRAGVGDRQSLFSIGGYEGRGEATARGLLFLRGRKKRLQTQEKLSLARSDGVAIPGIRQAGATAGARLLAEKEGKNSWPQRPRGGVTINRASIQFKGHSL